MVFPSKRQRCCPVGGPVRILFLFPHQSLLLWVPENGGWLSGFIKETQGSNPKQLRSISDLESRPNGPTSDWESICLNPFFGSPPRTANPFERPDPKVTGFGWLSYWEGFLFKINQQKECSFSPMEIHWAIWVCFYMGAPKKHKQWLSLWFPSNRHL